MSLSALAYVSTAVRQLNEDALQALLVDARAFNAREDVTGALLHHDGGFFQYLEGPPAGLARVYDRIKRSRQHTGVFEFFRHAVEARVFSSWHMGFAQTPKAVLTALAQARWMASVAELQTGPQQPGQPGQSDRPEGLSLLLSFWSDARRG